jgi:hypothetical protein
MLVQLNKNAADPFHFSFSDISVAKQYSAGFAAPFSKYGFKNKLTDNSASAA